MMLDVARTSRTLSTTAELLQLLSLLLQLLLSVLRTSCSSNRSDGVKPPFETGKRHESVIKSGGRGRSGEEINESFIARQQRSNKGLLPCLYPYVKHVPLQTDVNPMQNKAKL